MPSPTCQASLPDRDREVRPVWARAKPPAKARAARAAPARSARNRVMRWPSIRDGDPGGVTAEDRVGLFWEIVAVEDHRRLEFPGGVGTDGDVLELEEARENLTRNRARDVDIGETRTGDEGRFRVDRGSVHRSESTGDAGTVVRCALEVDLKRGTAGQGDGDEDQELHRRIIADADVPGSATESGGWETDDAEIEHVGRDLGTGRRAIGLRAENRGAGCTFRRAGEVEQTVENHIALLRPLGPRWREWRPRCGPGYHGRW